MTTTVLAPVGHEAARRALEAHLPPVTLLLGPASVGKRTLAEHLLRHHGIHPADTRRIERFTAEDARDIIQFSRTAPFGPRKVVFARLDGANEIALNALLKLLEEPPRSIAFLLTAVWPPLDTIMSRSHVHRLGLLPREDLVTILTRLGVPADKAARAAELGRGQVNAALQTEVTDSARNAVLSVLKALKDRDKELLEAAAGKWDNDAHALLGIWIMEAITARWSVFTASETFHLHEDKTLVRRMLLASQIGARPKIALRAGFLPLLDRATNT